MRFTLYRSNCLEVPENCTYPHKVEDTGKDGSILQTSLQLSPVFPLRFITAAIT